MRRFVPLLIVLAVSVRGASAHEVRPAYLELRQTGPQSYDVLFKIPSSGANLRLGLYPEFPPDCLKVEEPHGSFVNDSYTERWTVRRPGGMEGGTIGIVGLADAGTDVLVRFQDLAGRARIVRLTPDAPSFLVEASPGLWRSAATYARLGCEHILLGADHLLFVLGLLLIVPNRWMLLKTISSFTLAHSLTLAVATLGYASAPLPPLNAAIALSILFLGPEIVRHRRGETSLTLRHPWIVAFAFGLLHGFGFASGLSTIGLPHGEIPVALLFFNLGVEAGQVGFIGLVLLLLRSFRVLEIQWHSVVEWAPAYAVGSLGAFWTIQRTWILLSGLR